MNEAKSLVLFIHGGPKLRIDRVRCRRHLRIVRAPIPPNRRPSEGPTTWKLIQATGTRGREEG